MIQNPFKLAALCMLIGSVIPLVSPLVIPGASTPVFYLVSSSSSEPANLLPLRLTGGAGGYSTLTGSGPIGKFYFYQGYFVVSDSTPTILDRVLIGSQPYALGCTPYGQLGSSTSSSDYCAQYNSFEIQSDTENSQLGAFLVFNYVGGFYACGSGQDVWYLADPTDGPSGLQCSPINLYTVPV